MAKKITGNPWLDIWVRSRQTMRKIVDVNPNYGLWVLCVLYGFPMALSLAQSVSLAAVIPGWIILIAGLVVSPFLGFIGINITTWLLKTTGKWIGGQGTFKTIRSAVAWSNVPNAVTAFTWLALLSIFGAQIFCNDFTDRPFVGYQSGIIFFIFLIQSIVSVWGFIILLKTLGEVQGFSAWRALINVIIPLILVFALVRIVGWALWGTSNIIK